jgi:hypothetical protein
MERDAYNFCKEFSQERLWCKRNGLEIKDLEEEK